jgi:TonB family protein
LLTAPRWLPERLLHPPQPPPQPVVEKQEPMQFVMVQPNVDLRALKPPPRALPSDQDREARTRERAPNPQNDRPMSRGNTRQMLEQAEQQVARGPERTPTPEPEPPAPSPEPPAPPAPEPPPRVADAPAVQLPAPRPQSSARTAPSGSLGESLRNLQRYVQRDQFDNTQGGGAFGPAIQFDTKGVEFGPWIRRFVAQVKRNWEPLIPLAAMSMKGHVVVTFNVHKDGRITDLTVIGPSSIQAFNTAAYGALASSNPTAPLPPEYPSEAAFFTVTFFYNEEPQ